MKFEQMDRIRLLTPDDMRRVEQKAFALGIPSILLMEHAAMAVVDELEKALGGDCRKKTVLFLCGTGNNGGDGLAAARLFYLRGGFSEVWLSGNPRTRDAKAQLAWVKALDIPVINLRKVSKKDYPMEEISGMPKENYDAYVDAILGTGFHGTPDEVTARMITAPLHDRGFIPENDPPIIAVDIPSGIDGKTGEAPSCFMAADVTVTFHTPKPGLFLTKYRESVGKIVVADIGLREMFNAHLWLSKYEINCGMVLPPDLRKMKRRFITTHKGSCGRVLIYAGSMGMAGAAAMCAKAAVTAGAGLTTVACEKDVIPVLQTLVPNAMCRDIAEVKENPPDYDVLALGCGLGQSEEIWQNILKLWNPEKKSIWDADALNLLGSHPMQLGFRAVITPHPGEAARLLGCSTEEILSDRLAAARALAKKYHCIAVLKSDVTILCSVDADDNPYFIFNAIGSPALAKGGSGDALTGIMAVCLLNDIYDGNFPMDCAARACLWHGMAGLVGEEQYGQRELTTDQLISCLHEAERWGRGEREAPASFR